MNNEGNISSDFTARNVFRGLAGLVSLVPVALLAICVLSDSSIVRDSTLFKCLNFEWVVALQDVLVRRVMFFCCVVSSAALIVFNYSDSAGWFSVRQPGFFGVIFLIAAVFSDWLNSHVQFVDLSGIVCIGCMALGLMVVVWPKIVPSAEKGMTRGCWENFVSFGFLILMSISELFQTNDQFVYHSSVRATGIWQNPNTFGMLSGVALLAAVSHLRAIVLRAGELRKLKTLAQLGPLFLAVLVTGNGLLKSYSRGAWVGTICGFGYILIFSSTNGKWTLFRRLEHPLAAIQRGLLGVGVIGFLVTFSFCKLINVDSTIIHRIFSGLDPNDFSVRNRIAAWQGGTQMLLDRPFGFGWGMSELIYDQFYRPSTIGESAAIQLNDYLVLGHSAGILGLASFLGLVFTMFCSSPRPTPSGRLGTVQDSLIGCRAGAILLLVCFLFDGGLFHVSTGVIFWTFLGLGDRGYKSCLAPRT